MSLLNDPQAESMLRNIPEKTGKTLEQWFKLLEEKGLEKHGDMMKLLKGEYGVTHGFANTIVLLYRERAQGGAPEVSELIASQYEKKPDLWPWYERLTEEVMKFGNDVELAPKKNYVSLRRKKQFGIIQPSTKSRMDLGINLKGTAGKGYS